jgi:hypothetical protein
LRKLSEGRLIRIGEELILRIKCKILQVTLGKGVEVSMSILIKLKWLTWDIELRVKRCLIHSLTLFFLFY